MLNGKTIVIGITGSIAVYKMCDVISGLKKMNAKVKVIMTKNATEFVSPMTFETLTNNRVYTDMFDRNFNFEVEHISLAKQADIFLIAPATANIMGKIANGIADDMLSTTAMAYKGRLMFAPAMNTNMFESVGFNENLNKLTSNGAIIIEPDTGRLACGDEGKGRLAVPEKIIEAIKHQLLKEQDFYGKRILVTAGATREAIDGVRFISNNSSGKMGIAIANAAKKRGAEVALIYGSVTESIPSGIKAIAVTSTNDMYNAVLKELENNDIIIKAAAPSDYKITNFSSAKIKAEKIILEMQKNIDIAEAVGKIKGDKKLIIFSAETEDLIKNAKLKLEKKNADLVVANDVTKHGAGFNVDTNIISIIDKCGNVLNYDIMPKSDVANIILDNILKLG